MLLIDADLISYTCAATAENDPVEAACERAHRLMETLVYQTDESEYRAFLTGKNNFRKRINLQYKANRKDTVPPKWLQQTRQYLILEWNAETSDGCEADDLLGICQNDNTIIASLDKDLLMITGQHYNWRKEEFITVMPEEGIKHFYKQMLIGDKSDNIFGVDGIGKVKAGKLIDPLSEERDMFETVLDKYNGDFDRFVMNAQCLWIMQNEGEYWTTQFLKQNVDWISEEPLLHEVVIKYDSMTSLKEDTLTDHITTVT